MLAASPDIVHAHWTYEFAEAAVRSRLPHLVTMHDLGWDYFWQLRDAYRLMRLAMKYRTMPRVRHLTVVAPFMVNKARQYGYFGNVAVVPNGIEIPGELATRKTVPSRPKLVSVGNSGAIKNIRASVEAFKRIKRDIPAAELHLFGPGLDATFGTAEPGVIAHGNVEHTWLLDFLAREATLLIHPSKLETFGVVIAEAKARGVPVIGGIKSGGVPFVCGTDAGCLLVDTTDPDAIARAALQLLSGSDAHLHGPIARRDASARFDSRDTTQRYLEMYQEIAQQYG